MPEITLPSIVKKNVYRHFTAFSEKVNRIRFESELEGLESDNSHYIIVKNGNADKILIAFRGASKNIYKEYNFIVELEYEYSQNEYMNEELINKLLQTSVWIKHPNLDILNENNKTPDEIIGSWNNSFLFKQKTEIDDGLRKPQLGAVFSVLSHWTYSKEPAIVVMPTGTGKTETMLSILIATKIERLVVVVPTDALRDQISNKFITLGLLKDFGVVNKNVIKPIVGILKKIPTLDEVDVIFETCNVIVSTMAIFGKCDEGAQIRFAARSSHLFIDEAHHSPADTWNNFKEKFRLKSIVQFTATPFRNDDKKLEGKTVYNYPLKKAQEEEYFKTIKFLPVSEYYIEKADQVIAEKAVAKLQEDLADGLDHILMARVKNTVRADKVFEIYQKYSHLNPIKIYSSLPNKELKEAKRKILNKEARIIVCVDMLGEGFDMPELKIAAFHDIKKSLAITLQLAGRFTRSRNDLGDATFIANIAEPSVTEELNQLYEHDSDWNLLLPDLAQNINKEQEKFWDFIANFKDRPSEYPLHLLKPALSTIIFKVEANEWHPEEFRNGLRGIDSYEVVKSVLNSTDQVLVIILGRHVPVKWGNIENLKTVEWDLLIAYFNNDKGLLFIHASNTNSYYKEFAAKIIDDPILIKGSNMFRSFANINRLRFHNVGLKKAIGKMESFTSRFGSDIAPMLNPIEIGKSIKSNIFGVGYEDGVKVNIGCTHHGRVWSMRSNNINTWMEWCNKVVDKITDETINPDSVIMGALKPKPIFERPSVISFAIEWPEIIYKEYIYDTTLKIDDEPSIPIWLSELNIIESSFENNIIFQIDFGHHSLKFEMQLTGDIENSDYKFISLSKYKIFIEFGSKQVLIEDFFNDFPPTIYFVDGSMLEGNFYTIIEPSLLFKKNELIQWGWQSINIRKESQGIEKDSLSIQWKVIEWIKSNKNYDIIIDDDDKGEVADVVCFKVNEDLTTLSIDLYHCKFSSNDNSGVRLKDFYEVCGQAQKSVKWLENTDALFSSLLKRNAVRLEKSGVDRFELGGQKELEIIRKRARKDLRIKLKMIIVQPGLSYTNVTDESDILNLLGVVKSYLHETWQAGLEVICNKD